MAQTAREGRIPEGEAPRKGATGDDRKRRRRAAAARWRRRRAVHRLRDAALAAKRAALRLRDDWRGLKGWQRHWAVNIAIGVTIELLLHATASLPIVSAAQNFAMDAAMQAQAAFPSAIQTRTPLALIDVDAATWRDPSWGGGKPTLAPRDKLLALIEFAFKHHARIVVLDVAVDATRPEAAASDKTVAGVKSVATEPKPDAGATFDTSIQTLMTPTKPDDDRQLLVVRTIDASAGFAPPAASIADELRPSVLDDAFAKDANHLREVAPDFEVSRDGVLRDWQLWRAACQADANAGGHWRVIPSIQLTVAALLNDSGWLNQPILQKRQPCRTDFGDVDLVPSPATQSDIDKTARRSIFARRAITHHNEIEQSLDEGVDPSSRIFYRWAPSQRGSPIQTLSAQVVLTPGDFADQIEFHDGVVVIGQSFEDARDSHATPLGAMPGSLVVINAIGSILDYGVIQPPPMAARLAITACLIVIVGLAFALLDSFVATLVILAAFLPLVVAGEYALLRAGFWLDFALPLLGVYLHRLFATVHEYAVVQRSGGPHHED
jgi:hypothetical protein